MPGVSIKKGDLCDLLDELNRKNYLPAQEDGIRIRWKQLDTDPLFILGDHLGLTIDEEKIIEAHEHEIINVGPLSLHADHWHYFNCIMRWTG